MRSVRQGMYGTGVGALDLGRGGLRHRGMWDVGEEIGGGGLRVRDNMLVAVYRMVCGVWGWGLGVPDSGLNGRR